VLLRFRPPLPGGSGRARLGADWLLQKALRKAGEAVRFSEHLEEAAGGPAMYQHAREMDLEGIVLKRAKVAIAPAGAEAE
jgi:hypothetical protein